MLSSKDRAATLARMDGCLSLAEIFGNLVSAFVFHYVSYYGTYALGLIFQFFAFIYLWFVIKETSKPNPVSLNIKNLKSLCLSLFEPIHELAKSVVKSRPFGRRNLILIQVNQHILFKTSFHLSILIACYLWLILADP